MQETCDQSLHVLGETDPSGAHQGGLPGEGTSSRTIIQVLRPRKPEVTSYRRSNSAILKRCLSSALPSSRVHPWIHL